MFSFVFCRELLGAQAETNYISNIKCGVFVDALREWRNLHKVCNIAIEHQMACFRSFIFKRCQLQPELLIPQLLRHTMVLRALQHEALGLRTFEDTYVLGNKLRNSQIRQPADAARRAKNLPPTHFYKTDEGTGKKTRVSLLPGECKPPKEKKQGNAKLLAFTLSQESKVGSIVRTHKQAKRKRAKDSHDQVNVTQGSEGLQDQVENVSQWI